MVIDSSALVAILLDEPESAAFAEAIQRSGSRRMSAVSLLETSIVIESRNGPDGTLRLDLLIAEAKIDVVAFTQRDARAARSAYRRYGKGFHPASLNFGDCVSYALALDSNDTLLFKGEDFARTDVRHAVPIAGL